VTERIYSTDQYAREVDARVVEHDPDDGRVLLDRTVFYPGGGGPPPPPRGREHPPPPRGATPRARPPGRGGGGPPRPVPAVSTSRTDAAPPHDPRPICPRSEPPR
jgi:hypothetical protein